MVQRNCKNDSFPFSLCLVCTSKTIVESVHYAQARDAMARCSVEYYRKRGTGPCKTCMQTAADPVDAK